MSHKWLGTFHLSECCSPHPILPQFWSVEALQQYPPWFNREVADGTLSALEPAPPLVLAVSHVHWERKVTRQDSGNSTTDSPWTGWATPHHNSLGSLLKKWIKPPSSCSSDYSCQVPQARYYHHITNRKKAPSHSNDIDMEAWPLFITLRWSFTYKATQVFSMA